MIFIFCFLSVIFLLQSQLIEIFQLNESRYLNMQEEASAGYRITQYNILIDNLLRKPSLIPVGMEQSMRLGLGGTLYSHFIIGEAYFFGGLFFMVIVILGFLKAISRLTTFWRSHKNDPQINTVIILLSLILSYIAILSVMPGLHCRLVYIVLGLCLSFKKPKIPNLALKSNAITGR